MKNVQYNALLASSALVRMTRANDGGSWKKLSYYINYIFLKIYVIVTCKHVKWYKQEKGKKYKFFVLPQIGFKNWRILNITFD